MGSSTSEIAEGAAPVSGTFFTDKVIKPNRYRFQCFITDKSIGKNEFVPCKNCVHCDDCADCVFGHWKNDPKKAFCN